MKLEERSLVLLDITRAKSKLYEFGVDEEFHLELADNPKKLLAFTVGILGELSALEARPDDLREEYRYILKSQMGLVGQYFDALSTSNLSPDIEDYLVLLGAAAYYLADMPGSAMVLSNRIGKYIDNLTDSYLEGMLIWLLRFDHRAQWYYSNSGALHNELYALFEAFYQFGEGASDSLPVMSAAGKLRERVYFIGSDREVLLVDAVVSIAMRRIKNSSALCLPLYTGLDIGHWRGALSKPGFIKEFWPAQRLLGDYGVLRGLSAVVQMPTSAGKTKSTELIIRSSFLSGRSKVAIVVAPFKALCREITQNFERAFEGDSISVNELRDVTNLDAGEKAFLKFLLGDDFKGGEEFTVLVSTPEKLVYLLRQEPSLASSFGLLIFDEGHQFDSGRRGVTYELLIASLKAMAPAGAQKVLISAVMSNAKTIGEWLNGESGVSIQGSQLLPSARSVAFLSWVTEMGQLSYLSQDNKRDSGLYIPRVVQAINLGRKFSERKDRIFPDKTIPHSVSTYLGLKLSQQGPVALFCGDKKSITTISKLLVDYYSRGLALPKPRSMSDEVELDKIARLAELHFGAKHVMASAISLGALPHSANVPNGVRIAAEWAMESRKACFVICTSTLAQGVNLPIRYLIVSSVLQGGKKISTRDFQNLIGRAGRSGYYTEGGIIFADSKLYDARLSWQGRLRWQEALALLDFDNAEDCLSSLKDLIKPFSDYPDLSVLMSFFADPVKFKTDLIKAALASGSDVSGFVEEIDSKIRIIESIESYFLSVLKDNSSGFDLKDVVALAEQTLAFSLSDDFERAALVESFKLVSSRLFELDSEKYNYYGKTLLGLDKLKAIEHWVDTNRFELELNESSDDMLVTCWALIVELSERKVLNSFSPAELPLTLAAAWIQGKSYYEILTLTKAAGGKCAAGSRTLNISLDHVMDFTAAIAFDGMLIVGAIADVLEGKGIDEGYIDITRQLQNRMKLGLSSDFEMWLYGVGYADRELCKEIAVRLDARYGHLPPVGPTAMKDNAELIAGVLAGFPTVFSEVKVN